MFSRHSRERSANVGVGGRRAESASRANAHTALCGGHWVEALEGRVLMAAGDLDPAFGAGGRVVTRVPSYAHVAATVVVPLPDGKTLVAADAGNHLHDYGLDADAFVLLRYTRAGTLCPAPISDATWRYRLRAPSDPLSCRPGRVTPARPAFAFSCCHPFAGSGCVPARRDAPATEDTWLDGPPVSSGGESLSRPAAQPRSFPIFSPCSFRQSAANSAGVR